MIFACKNLKKSFGVNNVLENISFLLEEGEKAAIVGVNGAGKTTLFRLITREMTPDDGELIFKKGVSVGYLSQINDFNPENDINAEMLSVFADLIELEREIRRLERDMGEAPAPEQARLMERYSRLSHEFEDRRGFEYKSRIRGVIKGLGFSNEEISSPIKILSGGQKTRVSLAKLLLTQPDLLLLDEPTNHLDIEAVGWLEDVFLKNYPGSVLIISHDRYFLDKTATKIIEVEHGRSKVYGGNYTYYAYKKEIDRELALKHYLDQRKEIKKQEETIRKLRSFNREKSIKRAESREKMLAKMTRVERPADLPDKMRIILEPRLPSGNDVLSVERAAKSFGGSILFENAAFEIKRGEIVALIGANGVGKSTLFKMITGRLDYSGYIRAGANVAIGYYDQEHATLHEEKTLFGEMADSYPGLQNLEIRNLLAAFMFTGDDVFKAISTLSGGEKGRLSLAKLMLSQANFLMLDEPTNHLDMFSKEILEEALRNYTGTVFYISHDRYFINNTADRVLELCESGVQSYDGNYDYYVEKKKDPEYKPEDEKKEKRDDDRKRKKEEQNALRQTAADLKRAEREIAKIEEAIAEIDARLALPEVYSDYIEASRLCAEKESLEAKLLEAYENL